MSEPQRIARRVRTSINVTHRVRALMGAWVGPAITPRQVAILVRLEDAPALMPPLHQALSRAVRAGWVLRIENGLYQPTTPNNAHAGRCERSEATDAPKESA